MAVSPLNHPVGFALLKLPAGNAWLDQLSVLDLWQAHGFVEVPRGKWPRAFRAQFMAENSHGHLPWRRTIMQRRPGDAYLPAG